MAVLFVVVVVAVLAFWFLAIDRTTRKRLAVRETAPSTASFDDTESQTSFNISATPPHPYRPWRSGKFAMTMGIRKVDAKDWLGLDNKYHQEQQLRRELLEHHKSGVLQVLPGSEAACAEVLEMVIEHLTRWYPSLFYRPGGDRNYIRNGLTGRTYKVTAPYTIPPLEVAALLVMEDLNIMIKGFGPDAEEHYLAASFSMAPAGWYLEERIGWPLWKLHTHVPMWQEKLHSPVEKYFGRMKAGEIVSRNNFFVQTNEVLFQREPFARVLDKDPSIEDMRIRHERQTLRRMPRTGAILFTVRTYLTPVLDLDDDHGSVSDFLGAIRALPEDVAKYKGRPLWGEVVERWCEEVLARKDQSNGQTL